MSGLISNTELTEELEKIIPHCNSLKIISAFVTQPATDWLIQLVEGKRPSVKLVGRFTPLDFIQGSSDLSALRDCIAKGFQVKALTNLHAKIFQVDEENIFIGSANLTGKGLALVNDCNVEVCNRVQSSSSSKEFINRIINSASELTLDIIDGMEQYIQSIDATSKPELQMTWPEHVLSQSTELFVSDFPLVKPGDFAREYELNPSLPFAQIENVKDDNELASTLFKKTKAYLWLKTQVYSNLNDRDLGFGQVSNLLHDALCDDIEPYRKKVKFLQENLYSYLKIYATDEFEVYIPGKRSEVIRIK